MRMSFNPAWILVIITCSLIVSCITGALGLMIGRLHRHKLEREYKARIDQLLKIQIVHRYRGAWWFYDEALDRRGPYHTEIHAMREFKKYCDNLDDLGETNV